MSPQQQHITSQETGAIHKAYPWLGIIGGTITPNIAQSVGLPENYRGALVVSVQRGRPAEKAGLQGITLNHVSNTPQVGDIIIGIDEHPVGSIDDLLWLGNRMCIVYTKPEKEFRIES
jgi:S1-C subfamily serine protease